MMVVHMLGLQVTINKFQEHFSNEQLGDILGVTKDQVYKYGTGYTKSCSDAVVDAIYDNLQIYNEDGSWERVLVDYYASEQQYLALRKLKSTTNA